MHRNSSGGLYPRRILIAVAAALIPMIAGCESGFNAPSLHFHPPTDGTYHEVGNITISNAFVLGAPIGAVLRPGQNAGLFLGLVVNPGPSDRLVSISAPGVAQSVRLPASPITLTSAHPVLLTGPRPAVILEHLLRPLGVATARNRSTVVPITLTFANAGSVTIDVPVIPRANFYSTLSPPPALTAATPKVSPSPGKPGKTPSSSPTPSKSP